LFKYGGTGFGHLEEIPYIANKLNTTLDNIRDIIVGNGHKGSNNISSKLTESDVKQIKMLLKSGYSSVQISKQFGIHQTVVSKINVGKLWKHVN